LSTSADAARAAGAEADGHRTASSERCHDWFSFIAFRRRTAHAAGGGAGAALALVRPGLVGGTVVAVLLAARLGCANLDGGVARDGDRATPFGSVLNEAGDRAAELLALAGCLAFAPAALVLAAALAATLPSWVALAGAAAGLPRVQGGPVGKTERCLVLALMAFAGFPAIFLAMLAVGSTLTAAVRLARLRAGAR
jgi:CDP-diacylglycerol--glycerol-3-phosphate 3-phosphatidyltransferase